MQCYYPILKIQLRTDCRVAQYVDVPKTDMWLMSHTPHYHTICHPPPATNIVYYLSLTNSNLLFMNLDRV